MHERREPLVEPLDGVVEDADAALAHPGDIALEVAGLHGDVFQALAALPQEPARPRRGIPVLHELQSAPIAEVDVRLAHRKALVAGEVLRNQPEVVFETPVRVVEVVHAEADVIQTGQVHRRAHRLSRGFGRVVPAAVVRFDELDGQPGQLVRKDESLVPVVGVQNAVFPHADADLAEMRDVRFDTVGLECDVFQPLAPLAEEAVDPRLRVPVLHQVKPALVAEEDARVELHSLALVVPEVARGQPQNPLEAVAGVVQVPHHHADVLNAQNHRRAPPAGSFR